MTIMLNSLSWSKTTSYHGSPTALLEAHAVLKSSSLAKSMIHMSLLQLELQGWCLAMLEEIIGAFAAGNLGKAPSFFQSFPTACNSRKVFSSICPSRLGAALRMKLQKTLFRGLILPFTNEAADFTGSWGNEFFQNRALLIGRHE